MAFNPNSAKVQNEGWEFHYWFQGKGPLLILVPGGMGDGRQFNSIMAHLSQTFTVVGYNRRQASTSKAAGNNPLDALQHCRDIIAIARSLGQDKMSLFASDGGAIIAMEMAVNYPELIEHMIVHEAPTLTAIQNSNYYLGRLYSLYSTHRTKGSRAATAAFSTMLQETEDGLPLPHPRPENADRWWANDILLLTMQAPNLARIVENKVSIAVATSEKTKDAFYGKIVVEQEGKLKCPRLVLPGGHHGFESEAKGFAEMLVESFDMLEKRRRSRVFGLMFY